MKRRTRQTPVRVYTYGCLAPTEGKELIHEQMRLANAYQHELLDIELWRRAQYRDARREIDLAVANAESLLAAAADAFAAARERLGRRGDVSAERHALAEAKAALKAARKLAKDNPELAARAAEIGAEVRGKVKAARGRCGVYWGTYLLVEMAHEAVCKSATDPRHRPWNGRGRVGVQIHGAELTTASLFAGTDTRLRLDPLPTETWDARPGRRRAYSNVHIRIGTQEDGRSPIWATLPVLLHRPLPPGRITWAWIRMQRIGLRVRYDLQITIESEHFAVRPAGRSGDVGLKIGWQPSVGGITVGTLSDGTEYVVPQSLIDKMLHARSVRGIADGAFDEARRALIAWMAEHDVPEWMSDWSQHAARWNRHGKLRRIADRWAGELLGGEQPLRDLWKQWVSERRHASRDMYGSWSTLWPELQTFLVARGIDDQERHFAARLYWWMQQDSHLTQWECDETRRALGHRRELYRIWAARAASAYSRLTIDARDLRLDAERDNGKPENEIRQAVAPSTLRDAMRAAFGPRCEQSGGDDSPASARTIVNSDACTASEECA